MPWRGPAHEGDFPSLGWGLLEWFEQFPSPRDPSKPLRFTDDQAMSIVRWYEIDPDSGQRIYRRGYSRRAKGYGKSPVEAAKAIGEFRGPARFAGWDADGEPVGRPWGEPGYDDPPPWVQVGAVSIDQTDNTWSVVYYFLTENDHELADELNIDPGLTRCFLRHRPGAKMEPVTASAGSREGQPITYAVLDETHLWFPNNGGVRLARTLRRNAAKVGGTSFETTNAFVEGQESVAEGSYSAVRSEAEGVFADEVEAPREHDGKPITLSSSDATVRSALSVAYGDSWWADLDRHVHELRDPDTDWNEWSRFFFNWNTPANADDHPGPISPTRWGQLTDGDSMATDDTVRLGLDAPLDRKSACFSITGKRADNLDHIAIRYWLPPHDMGRLVEVAKQLTEGHGVKLALPPKSPALAWRQKLDEAGVPFEVAKQLTEGHGVKLALPPKSPALAWRQKLDEAGVPFEVVKAGDFAEAQAAIEQAVADGSLRHRGQPELLTAVKGLAARTSGDTSPWSRRSSSSNVAPLMAAAAAWAMEPGGDEVKNPELQIF